MLLGMKKGALSRVLVIETLLVGCISLAAGVVFGVLVSQGLAFLTAKLIEVGVSGYVFIFSASAAIKSAVYFGLAFLFTMILNTRNIVANKLIDLIYADRKAVNSRRLGAGGSAAMLLAGAAMLALAYLGAFRVGLMMLSANPLSLVIVALGIAGTFVFFASLSAFLRNLIIKIPGVYFKGLNLFVLKQVSGSIRASYVSVGVICLTLFVALTAVPSGMSIAGGIRVSFGPHENSTAAVISYIAVYLGIVFMLSSASVLAVMQLSQTSDDRERYALLLALGAGEKQINGAVFKQVFIFFAAPLCLAAVHSVVGVSIMNKLVSALTDKDTFLVSLISGAGILLLYIIYFITTYANAKRMVNPAVKR